MLPRAAAVKLTVVRITGPGGYWLSDDPALLDVPRFHRWLSKETFWAAGQTAGRPPAPSQHPLSIGLYAPDGSQAW